MQYLRVVVPHCGPRVGVRGSLLHVPQRHPGIQRGGDERMPQRVGRDGLADPGAAGGLADDPSGAVPVQPPPVGGQEHRPAGALADGQVDRPGCAGEGMRSTDGEELDRLLDEQLAYYRALAADYLNQALDLPGGDEVTEAPERFVARRSRTVRCPVTMRLSSRQDKP
jgi:hypothetical protein